jgi:uncharacterized membrane protein YkoI
MKIQMLCAAVALSCVVGCSTDRQKSEADTAPRVGTTLNDLPAAVQAAIRSEAPGAKIDDIDKERRSGRLVYEITFAEPGKNPKLHIAEDGTVLKEDEKIAESSGAAAEGPALGTKFRDVPAAVQQAIKEHAPNAAIDDIDKETRSGHVVYEVTFKEPGKNPKLHFNEDGSLYKMND